MLAQQLVGLHVVAEAVRGRVLGDRDVLVAAARAPPRAISSTRRVPVGERRVHVEVAADVVELDQLRQAALARRLELAAVLAQLGRDELHAEPLVDLLLGRVGDGLAALVVGDPVLAHVQAAPHRLGAQRLVVPAGAGEVLEQVAEGLLRHDPQVDGQAGVGDRLGARLAGGRHRVERVRARRRPRRARRGRSTRRRCRGPSRCPPAAGRCRPARRGCAAGWSRSAATSSSPTASAFESSMRAFGRPSAPAASAASTFSSAFLPKPGTSFSRPSSAAWRRSSSELTPSSSCSSFARLGPRPGMRVISTRPEGMRCFSLSAEGIEPVSSRASIFSAIVLPTPASSSARPCLRQLRRPTRRPRGSPSRRCGRRRRGRRPRRRARTGSPAPRRPRRSRRCASMTSLRAALPGAWLILPTYNEAENIEPIVRAVLPQLATTGLRAHDPRRRRRLARRHGRDRRPAGGRARRRCGCCTGRAKQGLGRAYLAGFERRARRTAPSWSSRWTPTSRTTPPTCRA